METPKDIILAHLSGECAHNDTPELMARNISMDLEEKFISFNVAEEVDNVDITDLGTEGSMLSAGSGPEQTFAQPTENPTWVLNRAIHTLALYRHLIEAEKLVGYEQELLARRPEPGVYRGKAQRYFTAIVTEDRRILVLNSDGQFNDSTETYDTLTHSGPLGWNLTRINTTEGTLG